MISHKHLLNSMAVASNGKSAVAVVFLKNSGVTPLKFFPSNIGKEECTELFLRAAKKLGYAPDRRYKNGFRKII